MMNSEVRNKLLEEIKKALDLSIQIANTKAQFDGICAQTFKAKPAEPVKRQIPHPQYPAITPQVPFWTADLIPALIFWPYILIYYFGKYQTKLKAEADRIRNSPEYQQQCAAIDEAHRQRSAAAEEHYQADRKQYNEKILPAYEKELAAWTKKHNEEVAALKAELDKLEKELAAHYEATKVVPLQYRSIDALRYIYDVMRSSNYTIAQAISSYEQAVQRQIEMKRLEEERRRAEAEEARLEAEERAAWAAEEAAEAARRAELTAAVTAAATAAAKAAVQQTPPKEKKKDYYLSAQCPRSKLGARADSCASCTLAPMCKTGSRR